MLVPNVLHLDHIDLDHALSANEIMCLCIGLRMCFRISWWRHQMETFSALLALCAGNSPVTGEFPTQRPVTQSVDVFFDLRLNKRLNKQSWGWWFETPPRPLWRHCNIDDVRMGSGSVFLVYDHNDVCLPVALIHCNAAFAYTTNL